MTFVSAVTSGYRRALMFSGRAGRADYWWFLLFYLLVLIAIAVVEGGGKSSQIIEPNGSAGFRYVYQAGPVAIIWSLINLLPMLALGTRRLHDLDKSGLWLLLILLPVFGWIFLMAWFCMRGTSGANRFGPAPIPPG